MEALCGIAVLPQANVELVEVIVILILSVNLDLSVERITVKASILWRVVLLTAAKNLKVIN